MDVEMEVTDDEEEEEEEEDKKMEEEEEEDNAKPPQVIRAYFICYISKHNFIKNNFITSIRFRNKT